LIFVCEISVKLLLYVKKTVFLCLSPSRPTVEGLPPNGDSSQHVCYSTCLSFLRTVRRAQVYGQP